MKIKKTNYLLAAATLGLGLVVVAPAVYADNQSNTSDSETHSATTTTTATTTTPPVQPPENAQELAQKLAEQRQEAEKKHQQELEKINEKRQEALKKQSESEQEKEKKKLENFKKSCEDKREDFKTRMSNVASFGQKQAETLDDITDRVDAFVKSNNLQVPNYSALLNAVHNQQQVVHELRDTAKEKASDITCETPDSAKLSVFSFRTVAEQEVKALNDLKKDLKDLISAVKTAANAAKQ